MRAGYVAKVGNDKRDRSIENAMFIQTKEIKEDPKAKIGRKAKVEGPALRVVKHHPHSDSEEDDYRGGRRNSQIRRPRKKPEPCSEVSDMEIVTAPPRLF